jgi:hypothetical protein
MNVHKLAGESAFWRELCNGGQYDICIGHAAFTLIWPQQVRAFILLALHGAVQSCCQGSEFVFIQDVLPPPTINQSCWCGAIQCPLYCYNIREAHGDALQSSIWPLETHNGVTTSIWSLRTHFWIKNKWVFGLSLQWIHSLRWAQIYTVH